ncbi:O-antigen ligase family protein [Nonlabens marinus]|nr:O-antigen ligase family protein [Nonlabens marinus]
MSYVDKSPMYGLFLLFAMPVIPHFVSSVLIFLFLASSFVSYVKRKNKTFLTSFYFLSTTLFFVYLLSLTYSENLEYAIKKISTALPLIAIPLAFSFFSTEQLNFCRTHLKDYLKTYIAAVGLLIGISTVQLLADHTLVELFNAPRGFYHSLKLLYGMDSLYLSYHLSIAVLFATYLFYISKKFWKAIVAFIILASLFIILLYLGFKAGLIASILSFGIISILTNKWKLWILFASMLTLLIATIIFSPKIADRFSELLIVKNEASIRNTSTVRSDVNQCTFLLLPEAGFIGYGIGDGKAELQECLSTVNKDLANRSYNTHNQYFSIIVNVGFIGLTLFLGSLFILSIISLNVKNHLAITLAILFAVWMLAENILERQGGIMYFSLFTSFLFVINFKTTRKLPLLLSHEKIMEAINK